MRFVFGILLAFGLLLLLATESGAQTTTTTTATTTTTLKVTPDFPSVAQPNSVQNAVRRIANGQRCNATPCETGPFTVTASDYPGPAIYFDCAGTCVASLVCRLPGSRHDVSIADSGTLTNAGAVKAITAFCPTAYLTMTTCTTCNLSAWIINSRPN